MAKFIIIFGAIILMFVGIGMGLFGAFIYPISAIVSGNAQNVFSIMMLFIISGFLVFIISIATLIHELTKKEVTVKHERPKIEKPPLKRTEQEPITKDRSVIICSKCNSHNEHDAKFCKNCGKTLVKQ